MISNLLVIDIETVPMVETFDELDENWKQLWIDKTQKQFAELTPQETWKMRGGILAEFGKIICISTGYFYNDINQNQCFKIKSVYGKTEKEVLERFIDLCNKVYSKNKNFVFAGHNIKEFDVPYLCRRILINDLALPEYLWLHNRKPWEVNMFDTLAWWRFGDNKNYTSLHLIANALNIKTSKDDIDGSQVQQVFYQENNLQRIVNYCQKDIVVVANIILKFQGMSVLKHENVKVVE